MTDLIKEIQLPGISWY